MFVPHFFYNFVKKFFFVKSNYVVHYTYLFSSHVFVRLHDGSITLEPGQDNHKIPFVEHDFCIPEILFVKLVAFIIEFVTDYPKHYICILKSFTTSKPQNPEFRVAEPSQII